MQRKRSVPHSFTENIATEKEKLEQQATELPEGPARDQLLRKIRQLKTASRMSDWLQSPGLGPPQ